MLSSKIVGGIQIKFGLQLADPRIGATLKANMSKPMLLSLLVLALSFIACGQSNDRVLEYHTDELSEAHADELDLVAVVRMDQPEGQNPQFVPDAVILALESSIEGAEYNAQNVGNHLRGCALALGPPQGLEEGAFEGFQWENADCQALAEEDFGADLFQNQRVQQVNKGKRPSIEMSGDTKFFFVLFFFNVTHAGGLGELDDPCVQPYALDRESLEAKGSLVLKPLSLEPVSQGGNCFVLELD